MARLPDQRPLSVVSLYTGAGGLDLGFEAAGFETRVAVELAPTARETLRLNRPAWTQVEGGDALTLDIEKLLELGGLRRGEVDALIGGPPCQPFSKSAFWSAGSTRRLEDPRARTLEAMLGVAENILPGAVIIENVRGIAYREKNDALGLIGERFNLINELHGTSYKPTIHYLLATDFGVPQLRERAFVVALRDGRRFEVPTPIGLPVPTAWDAIGNLNLTEAEISGLAPRGKWAGLLPTIPEGENYLWHTERGGGLPLFGWRTRYWSFLLKLAKNKPAWTIQADPGPATGPFHWDGRQLSIREMARLQTFPADWLFAGDYRQARRQIGNAVPPALGEAVARQVAEALDGRHYAPNLELAVYAGGQTPPAAIPLKVPERYAKLSGVHDAHPGTGMGPSARDRRSAPSGRADEHVDSVNLGSEVQAAA